MKLVRMTDNAVTAVEDLRSGETVTVTETAPRIGAVLDDNGRFVAPTNAFLADASGLVVEVALGAYADEQPDAGAGQWHDIAADPLPGPMRVVNGLLLAVRDIAAEVNRHAVVVKIASINATRTDGGEPFPATAEALTAAKDRYRDMIDEYNLSVAVGDAVSPEQTATVKRIQAGFQFFKAVDAAASMILAAGDAADPVSTDDRWPGLPSA